MLATRISSVFSPALAAPLKSKTVSFGQPMPEREMEEAARLSMQADLYLTIGSSLVVEPAASLPRLGKEHGAALVIINNTETPLDYLADLIIREPIGQTMRAVLERCEGSPQSSAFCVQMRAGTSFGGTCPLRPSLRVILGLRRAGC